MILAIPQNTPQFCDIKGWDRTAHTLFKTQDTKLPTNLKILPYVIGFLRFNVCFLSELK